MKYFSINGTINEDLLEKFMQFANCNPDEKWVISLHTGGGNQAAALIVCKIINDHKEVDLIIDAAYSAGFIIAYKCNCHKIITPHSKGMHHYSNFVMDYSESEKPAYEEHRIIKQEMKNTVKDTVKIAKSIMTEDEYNRFKDDRDVFFGFTRLKQIFPDAQIIK